MFRSRISRVLGVAFLVLAVSAVVPPGISGQEPMQDVVYLENGSVIRGTIIDQIPDESLRIRMQDGSVFVFRMQEVERITREPAIESPSRKNPGTALTLAVAPGFLGLHGLGQFYNNEIGKGLLFFGAGIVGGVLVLSDGPVDESDSDVNTRATIGAVLWLGSLTWSSIDAYRSAQRINRQQGVARSDGGPRFTFGLDESSGRRVQIGLSMSVGF
jgi:hypothetical protein